MTEGLTMENDLPRRLAAEAIGTGLLVTAVVGSGIMAEKLAGGNVAIALLGNTLPTGAILVVLIAMLGPISGAHFNPAVSLVMSIRRELPWGALPAYVIAQLAGGFLGSLVAHGMFDLPLLQASQHARTGINQWFAEFVATFGLLFTIIGTVRFKPDFVAVAVGLYITSAYWFTASTSFANPAVTFARAFTDTFSGIAPSNVPGFIAAQVVGAVAGGGLAGWLFRGASREATVEHSQSGPAPNSPRLQNAD
jgi:glycerol uptake facilitator-like aquaporin